MKILSLCIGDRDFGMPIALIREILDHGEHTPVHKAPEDVLGLMNVRGQIVTVVCPGIRLGSQGKAEGVKPRYVILNKNSELAPEQKKECGQEEVAEEAYALYVDGVREVYEVEDDKIDPVPGNTPSHEARLLAFIARIDDEVLPVLRAATLVGDDPVEETIDE